MKIKSLIILGITGGMGYSFFKKVVSKDLNIYGFYCHNDQLASQIRKQYPKVVLTKVDLSASSTLNNIEIPNCEGLLYVVGQPHFGEGLFDFKECDLQNQMNLNINSLFLILQKMCSKEKPLLRRIVVVNSLYPENRVVQC